MIVREKKEMIPHGDTAIKKGDTIVIAAQEFHDDRSLVMQEIYIEKIICGRIRH